MRGDRTTLDRSVRDSRRPLIRPDRSGSGGPCRPGRSSAGPASDEIGPYQRGRGSAILPIPGSTDRASG